MRNSNPSLCVCQHFYALLIYFLIFFDAETLEPPESDWPPASKHNLPELYID